MKNFLTIIVFLLFFGGCARTKPAETAPQSPPPVVDERAAKLIKIKDAVAPFFKPMGKPEEYDWLASFEEAGQTFEQYLTVNPTLPTAERQTIYIQPVGKFSAAQEKVLRETADYMRAFYNLPVKLNAPQRLEKVPPEMERINPYDGQRQIRTVYFLDDLLPKLLPADAAAFICFTNYDIYPDDGWNYVFGQATLQNRVGVWSLWRFGKPEKSAEDYRQFLARTLKVAMHETGHMFTMLHCTKYECLMSGSNHLGETDRHPLDVCPECMAKINWAMNYEPAARYRNLAEFWRKLDWTEEEKSLLEKAEKIKEKSESD